MPQVKSHLNRAKIQLPIFHDLEGTKKRVYYLYGDLCFVSSECVFMDTELHVR